MNICPVTNGDQVLRNFAFHTDRVGGDFGIMIGLFVGFRLIAFLALKARSG